ncbi:MAG: HDOD domain-containing protein [Gammaproteobacteria bacterium]|nr:HDOD domain-containing protein [Gammaproteobacteria bacterium]
MKSILFVDDEPNVLDGLRRMLRPMRNEWEMRFAASGAEALALLEAGPCDLVVADMRMPGMTGVELLEAVQARRPETVRIILSGHSEMVAVLQTVRSAHQFLAKPCEAETVRATISRAFALRARLRDEGLVALVAGLKSLPSLPALYQEITAEIDSPDGSVARVGEIIARDVAMTAKLLQLVNSAFFGLPRAVNRVGDAVAYLGLDVLRALVLTSGVFSHCDEKTARSCRLEELWRHSAEVGALARRIARAQGCEGKLAEIAMMAGMLHDVGRVLLAANRPQEYAAALARAQEIGTAAAEREAFGHSHAEVGAYLMGIWGLPDLIVEAIAYHHAPGESQDAGFTPLTAVHVADALCDGGADADSRIDAGYLARIGVADALDAWRAMYDEHEEAA